jgi:hypothetical protein
MKTLPITFAFLLFLVSTSFSQNCIPANEPCTNIGCDKDSHGNEDLKEKALNKGKNRNAKAPAHTNAQHLTIGAFLNSAQQPDSSKYLAGTYVEVTGGYLVRKPDEMGPERCNCQRAKKSAKDGDVHMYIGLVPNAPIKNCMVVEVTPSWKSKRASYSFKDLIGKKVKVKGYLLYDYIHEPSALNTCHTCTGAWRKTCWEIHPVVAISEDL